MSVPAEQSISILVSWHPAEAAALHDSLQFTWRRTTLLVSLSGKAVAPPPSALMYAAVKRAASDISSTCKEGAVLPATSTGQKVVKSQRLGGISPGHPTFEAAMRNSTVATSNRRQPGSTPGLSRYAVEAMPKASLAERLEEMAASPEKAKATKERPRLRMRRPGAAPLRSLRLSVNQQSDSVPAEGLALKPAPAAASGQNRAGDRAKQGSKAHKGFSFFHSGYRSGAWWLVPRLCAGRQQQVPCIFFWCMSPAILQKRVLQCVPGTCRTSKDHHSLQHDLSQSCWC